MSGRSMCETCAYYAYDEDYECYFCELNLDEDEMVRFMQGAQGDCHYFQPYDEYSIVKKQN